MRRPDDSEYADYYRTYTSQVPDGDVVEILRRAPEELIDVIAPAHGAHETFAYAPDKWSIRELIGHVNDTERLFGYRALHIARGDTTALPGMEQDDWAAASNAKDRSLAELLAEFAALRTANTFLFDGLEDTVLDRSGVASGVSFTVRSLAFILAGHELHHRRILRERYLPAIGA